MGRTPHLSTTYSGARCALHQGVTTNSFIIPAMALLVDRKYPIPQTVPPNKEQKGEEMGKISAFLMPTNHERVSAADSHGWWSLALPYTSPRTRRMSGMAAAVAAVALGGIWCG